MGKQASRKRQCQEANTPLVFTHRSHGRPRPPACLSIPASLRRIRASLLARSIWTPAKQSTTPYVQAVSKRKLASFQPNAVKR